MAVKNQVRSLQHIVVTADQMRQIEERVFAARMPVPALMEKVAGRITQRIEALFLGRSGLRVGVLVGPGHNGGDALVVARELHFKGCQVVIYQPFTKLKELTGHHAQYCSSLGIPTIEQVEALQECDLLVDGLFGFGLERSLSGDIANAVDQINQWHKPVVSIDLPTGLHTDTGQALGTAIQATHTLCLGLWKQGLLQDQALAYVGQTELVDFDLPLADIHAVLGDHPPVQRITSESAIAHLPLPRSLTAHKYTAGHLLLICGSRRYAGAAILSGLGARASGVGMLSIAVPASLQPVLMAQLPEALVVGCPETPSGAILCLPDEMQLDKYSAIACGPGLTMEAKSVVRSVLGSSLPVVLDADGLNMVADWGTSMLETRTAPTILTPHPGEFKRLFPHLAENLPCRVTAVREAAAQTGAIVLLKGARVTISDSHTVWINPASTPALARGGSGDVLTGLIGGLLAQPLAQQQTQSPIPHPPSPIPNLVQSAVWWHSQAGILAAQERTELGVDAHTLAQYLIPALKTHL